MAGKQSRSLISSFLNSKNEISVEIAKTIIEPSMIENYISEFSTITVPNSQVVMRIAKMFFKNKTSEDVKTKIIGTNEQSMFNEQIKTFKLDKSLYAFSKKITAIDSVPQIASRAELILQYTFELLNNPNWVLKISAIKRIDNPIEFATKLKMAKEALIDTPLNKMSIDAYDYVLTEIVRINPEPIEYIELIDIVNGVMDHTDNNVIDQEYQDTIFNIAKDIYIDATTIARFKRDSGFKRLCPSPIELNRILYFKKMLPSINQYFMTDKMDGLHAVLVIDEIFKMNGKKKNFIGSNIYAVSDKIYEINKCEYKTNKSTLVEHTVLDVEMMTNKNKENTFHCFDIIVIHSRRVSGLPFYKRFEHFDAANTLLQKYELGSVKEFIKLSDSDYCNQITTFYKKHRDYNIDGIIFTPAGTFYKEAVKLRKSRFEKIFNTDYSNTISFKWKPIEQLTIDFYLMAYPKKKNSYVLCSGVDNKTFKLLNMSFFNGYKAPDSPNSYQYFPIQFETYDGEFDYVWEASKSDNEIISEFESLDGMVGEFRLANDNGLLPKPQLLRLRTDRINDIAKGEYYGNALRYSELIWHSIKYPLKIETMCDSVNTAYFAAEDSDGWYKAGRNFNSFVKTYLMEMYLPAGKNSRLMDIAAGKGQDLARAVDLGYSEIVALDKDTDALTELLERKYNLRVRTKNASASVHIKKIDLEESADTNIKDIKLSKESTDNMMINFALHYICHSTMGKEEPIVEFAKLCNFYLKEHGKLLITTFNGEDVFNKLKESDEWNITENNRLKYSIKKNFASDTLTNLDQSIDVLLPFSAGVYYQEYLVNYKYVQSVFEKNGFTLISSDSFESLLRTFRKQNNQGYRALTDGDKEYVSMYGFMIFEKN